MNSPCTLLRLHDPDTGPVFWRWVLSEELCPLYINFAGFVVRIDFQAITEELDRDIPFSGTVCSQAVFE